MLKKFGIPIDDIGNKLNILLSSSQEITALISSYGKVTGFLLICIIVSLYEEIIFRGVILDTCYKYINFKVANIIQALLFSAIHHNLFLFPAFFAFGIITGSLSKKSGGLLPGIVFHVLNNILAASIILIR